MALINEFGFSIGGNHSSNYNIKVIDIHRNVLPEISENLLNIPARKGSYFTGITVQHRVIQVDIKVVANSHAERLSYVEKIAYWLFKDIHADQEIVFDDATDRAYYGHVANSTAIARSLYYGKATIEIHCSDPYAYGTNQINFSADNTGLFTIDNLGSAPVYPIFTTNFANPASSISYVAPNGIILLGTPSNVDKTTVPATEFILNDNMQDVSTWTTADASLIDGRTLSGSVTQGANGMYVGSFGTGSGWYGPAVRKNLPTTVQDFTVKAQIQLASQNSTQSWDASKIGAIDIYLYDANNVKVGKLSMWDGTTEYDYNVPRMEFNNGDTLLEVTSSIPSPQVITQKDAVYYTVVKGDNLSTIAYRNGIPLSQLESINGISPSNTTIYPGQRLKIKDATYTQTVYSTNMGNYNNFNGQLTIQRIGTTWYAEVKRTDMGSNTFLQSNTYYDVDMKYSQSPVAYIVINLLACGTYNTPAIIEVDGIQVIKNNPVDNTQNQTIFQAGDELVVDMNDSSARLNGDLIMNQLDIGSTFFPIDPGTSEVRVLTDDQSATHTVTYTPRYL